MIVVLIEVPDDFEARVQHIDGGLQLVLDDEHAITEADIIVGRPDVGALSSARKLRWLQLSSAGANRYVDVVREDVILTTASGVYGIPAAEHVFAMMLGLVRNIPNSVRQAQRTNWDRGGTYDEIFGRTCGILGLGDIGLEVASRAHAFGMRVIGLKRTRGRVPEYVDEVFVVDELATFLAECDHIVNTLPDTKHTHHLLDEKALSQVKPGSCFYNVGRGRTVDEDALIEALRGGRIAGAGLDVFPEEPLPEESPLWGMTNVIITPHVAGLSPREDERVAQVFLENLARWVDKRPLLNVVDRELGY